MPRILGRARPRTGRPPAADPGTDVPGPGPARLLVELAGVEKTYVSGAVTTPALRGVDLTIAAGEMVAVVGPSGSGKSTVTNLIAGIDRPTAGTVTVAGQRLDTMGEEALARWRGDTVGHRVPVLPAAADPDRPRERRPAAGLRPARRRPRRGGAGPATCSGSVGLGDKADRLPMELSGGEQQRVAIARALACEPALLIGDEPTGNLDSQTADEMFDLLVDVHRRGTTVVFVTHDPQLAARAPRTVTVRDGRIVDDTGPGDLRRPAGARVAAVRSGSRRSARPVVRRDGTRGTIVTASPATRRGPTSAGTAPGPCSPSSPWRSPSPAWPRSPCPGLIDRRMNDEVRATRLADVTLPTDDLVLAPGTLDDLRALPNVDAAEARVRHTARVAVGNGTPEQATVWGVDVGGTDIDVVDVDRGGAPGPGQVLVDDGNDGAGEDARAGDRITITDAGGGPVTLEVSGTGGSLATSPTASPDGSSEPVFYVAPETARRLTGGAAVDEILLRLHDATPAAAEATVDTARDTLRAASGRDVITDLPEVREPGDWPGHDLVEQITSLFQVVTLLAFVSALFLVANTMNTLIAEQGSEIAVMKAVGGRRRQVAGVFVRSALLVGVAGAVLGTILGIAVSSALAGFFTAMFGVSGGLAVDGPIVVAILVIGPLVAVAATLPALRRGLRRSVAEGLDDRGVAAGAGYGRGRLDRLVARAGVLPPSARLGLRNALRQRRRSAATVAQLTLAVAAALALLGLGASIGATIDDVYDHLDYDVVVQSDDGAPAFDAAARRVVEDVDGVADAAPVLVREVRGRRRRHRRQRDGARSR